MPVLPSASRNANVSKTVTVYEKYQAAHLVVDVTSGSPNLIVTVSGLDTVSSKKYTLLTSSTISSGTTVLKIGPDYTAGTNVAKDYLPHFVVVDVTQSGNVYSTYSIGMSLI